MTFRGHCCALLIGIAAAAPLSAQNDTKLDDLGRRLEELTRQVTAIRQEIEALKSSASPAVEAVGAPGAGEDLTRIELAPQSANAPVIPQPPSVAEQAPPASGPSAMTDVQTINNAPTPGAAKIFNPDISAIGNFLGRAGSSNPFESGHEGARQAMALDEVEVGMEAFIDPYAKGKFFLSASPEGVSIEEGYAQFVSLPWDLTAKVGRAKATFGKANTWHTHARPWVDQPLVIHNFFGDEQLADSGVSLGRIIPAGTLFVEATAEAFRGDVAGVFRHRNENDLLYNAHLKVFRDLTDDSNLEAGGSYARGTSATEEGGTSRFGGIDLTYRWKPLERGMYRSLIARIEAIVARRSMPARDLRGFYGSLDYQLGRRWYTGVRLDRAARISDAEGNPLAAAVTDRGVSATLTFWPSEFSQLRAQLRRTSYGDVRRTVDELLLQLQFSIGAHGAHTF